MANMTRRDALKAGGISAAGLAAFFMGGCSTQSNTSTSDTSASSTSTTDASQSGATAARELKIDSATGLLARDEFIGLDAEVEFSDGSKHPAIIFDNGATTPSLAIALEEIQAQLPMYGSIGRGKGQKSSHSTEVFNAAQSVVLDFFGAPSDTYTCAFSDTATDGLNKVSSTLCDTDTVVITTRSEHHANDLPWRKHATEVRYVEVDELGRLRMEDFNTLLADGKVGVVSVQAASNVTGYVHDVHV